MHKLLLSGALIFLVAISGCSDNGTSPSGTTTSSTTTTTPPLNNSTSDPGMDPIIITGTVSGAQDCTLAMSGQAPATAATITIPAEAANRTYTLNFSAGQSIPNVSRGCIGFGTGALTGGTTGTIPEGTTTARIGYNAGQGRTFTLTIA